MRMVTPPRIRRFLGLVALAALTAMGASGAEARRQSTQAQAGPIPTGAISGVVVDATTGRPVADAAVRLSRVDSSSFPTVARVTTDARGRFVFRNLPAAPNYALGAGASRFGYLYTSYGSTSPGGAIIFNDVTRIALADGQWINTITIPLWRQPTVTGRVTDERGEPVVGIAVRAFSVYSVAGQPQWVGGPIAVTDDRGAYRITGLDPGNYVVSVLSVQTTVLDTTTEVAPRRAIGELESGGYGLNDGVLMTPAIDVDGKHRLAITYFAAPPPPSGDSARAYPAMFYPTATTIAAADLIPLGYGDSKADVDFSLRPVPTFRVSGRLDTRGAMPPPFLLRLMPQGSERLGPGSEAATSIVEPDGAFTFLNVPNGQYTLLAQAGIMDFSSGNGTGWLATAPGFSQGGLSVGSMSGTPGLSNLSRSGRTEPVWGRAPVIVGGQNVTNIVVPLHPVAKLQGHIAFPETTKPIPAALLITAEPANGDPTLGRPIARAAKGDGSFPFTLEGAMGGSYLIRTSLPDFGILSITAAEHDVTETGIDVSAGGDVTDIVVTLTDKLTHLGGGVHDSQGPVAAGVIAFPVDPALRTNYGWTPRRFRTVRSTTAGAFTMSALPEGDYFVIAVDRSQIDAWTDAKFLAAAEPLATRVSLKWGEQKSVDLAVNTVKVK